MVRREPDAVKQHLAIVLILCASALAHAQDAPDSPAGAQKVDVPSSVLPADAVPIHYQVLFSRRPPAPSADSPVRQAPAIVDRPLVEGGCPPDIP